MKAARILIGPIERTALTISSASCFLASANGSCHSRLIRAGVTGCPWPIGETKFFQDGASRICQPSCSYHSTVRSGLSRWNQESKRT
jgi:hypothetical protein